MLSPVSRISTAPGVWWIYYTCLKLGFHVLDEIVKCCGVFFNGWMWATCMEWVHSDQDFWGFVCPKFLHKLPALSACTETKFPDRKEDLCWEPWEENNLKLKLWSMNLVRVPLDHITAGVRVWPLPMSSAHALPWVFKNLLFSCHTLSLVVYRWVWDTFIQVLAERCPPPLSSCAMGWLQKFPAAVGIPMCYRDALLSWGVGKDQLFLHGCSISCCMCEHSLVGLCPLPFMPPSANTESQNYLGWKGP